MRLGIFTICALTVLGVAGMAPAEQRADQVDGLYRPAGERWSCSAEQIGMDGGSLSVQNGVLRGVETYCELTAPRAVGAGTQYTALCSAEGDSYAETLTLTPMGNGLKVERNGFTANWIRCPAAKPTLHAQGPSNGRWTFGGRQGVYESATRDGHGNEIMFTCSDLGDRGGLWIDLGGQPIAFGPAVIEIDGAQFNITALPGEGRIDTSCRGCGETYKALWAAAAAGQRMTITGSDGRGASFGLRGSRDALDYVPCDPEGGL